MRRSSEFKFPLHQRDSRRSNPLRCRFLGRPCMLRSASSLSSIKSGLLASGKGRIRSSVRGKKLDMLSSIEESWEECQEEWRKGREWAEFVSSRYRSLGVPRQHRRIVSWSGRIEFNDSVQGLLWDILAILILLAKFFIVAIGSSSETADSYPC